MNLTEAVTDLLAVPSPGERLPLDLARRLVRYGWRDLLVCPECGRVRPGCTLCDLCDVPVGVVPAWGPGLVTLLVAVANWPTDDQAKGLGAKSGKRMRDGGSRYPYGGLGLPHLDSGGLLDAYDRWGWPGLKADYAPFGRPHSFDHLCTTGGGRWSNWLAWADGLLADPSFHTWLVAYWLRKFWAPSYESAFAHVFDEHDFEDAMWREIIARAITNARIRNSASSWADKWAHLPADDQQAQYIEQKRASRGDKAARRTERQVQHIKRGIALIEQARIEALP